MSIRIYNVLNVLERTIQKKAVAVIRARVSRELTLATQVAGITMDPALAKQLDITIQGYKDFLERCNISKDEPQIIIDSMWEELRDAYEIEATRIINSLIFPEQQTVELKKTEVSDSERGKAVRHD